MFGTITVQPVDSPYPQTPDEVALQAAADLESEAQLALSQQDLATSYTTTAGENGNTIYTLNLGYTLDDYSAEYFRFSPPDLTLNPGDSVEWISKGFSGHTVTFASGTTLPEFFIKDTLPDENGLFDTIANPLAWNSSGGDTYSGQDYFNSGYISPFYLETGIHSYTLTFDTPGTYSYTSLPYAKLGMSGTITVADNSTALPSNLQTAPKTSPEN